MMYDVWYGFNLEGTRLDTNRAAELNGLTLKLEMAQDGFISVCVVELTH
jgi:hypothetical protein